MYELIFYIFCLIGTIYLLCRFSVLLRTLLQLFSKSGKAADKSTKDKISELCHCSFSVFSDLK